jgi:hypothetical protein
MLFDVDPKLIKTLMREQKVGLRDAVVKPVAIGPNDVTYIGAKSMRGVEFLKFLEAKLPKIVLDFDPDDEDEDETDSDPDWEEPEDEETDTDSEDDAGDDELD